MIFRTDLHIHSPYSRATSPACSPAGIAKAAQIKGITVMATGDCVHPVWLSTLEEQLEPAEQGLYRLDSSCKPSELITITHTTPDPRFMLSTEISLIYKHNGATRKVHHNIYLPDFSSARRFQTALAARGNIASDGRPILGMSSYDLLSLLLDCSPQAVMIPAHIWTPWFSLFGSRSGYDAIEECFLDLTPEIFALETGLSADPDMIRRVSALDRFALVSNSDCHSLGMVGREATVFDTELSYNAIMQALRNNDRTSLLGTIEFFPEEGKYHHDGHRACGVCFSPAESKKHNNSCPVCHEPLTLGVLHRVHDLADRENPWYPDNAPARFHTIPLREILADIFGVGCASKKVQKSYEDAIQSLGTELDILLDIPIEFIEKFNVLLASRIHAMRQGYVCRKAGYDGVYGTIRAHL